MTTPAHPHEGSWPKRHRRRPLETQVRPQQQNQHPVPVHHNQSDQCAPQPQFHQPLPHRSRHYTGHHHHHSHNHHRQSSQSGPGKRHTHHGHRHTGGRRMSDRNGNSSSVAAGRQAAAMDPLMAVTASGQISLPDKTELGPMYGGIGLHTKGVLCRIHSAQDSHWGITYLFKESAESEDRELPVDITNGEEFTRDQEEQCRVICLADVPNCVGHLALCDLLGKRWLSQIAHIRMVTAARGSGRLILIKFGKSGSARDFRKDFQGRQYIKDDEQHTCDVVFLQAINFDPIESKVSANGKAAGSSQTKPVPEPPICPVCLERMGEDDSLITIACQHVFHIGCLGQWSTGGCPVCRFASPLADVAPAAEPFGRDVANFCTSCQTREDLWICLICGHVGCGRYKGGHAKEHWTRSAHHFALEIETQYVWDYADDKWVHRQIRQKGTDKHVDTQVPEPEPATNKSSSAPVSAQLTQSNMDAIGLQYTQMFANQCLGQIQHYNGIVAEKDRMIASLEAVLPLLCGVEASPSNRSLAIWGVIAIIPIVPRGGLNMLPSRRANAASEAQKKARQRAPELMKDTGRGGQAGGRRGMRERQSKMVEEQLEMSLKRAREEEEKERERVENMNKSTKTEADISGARERFLARKRAAEEAKKAGTSA